MVVCRHIHVSVKPYGVEEEPHEVAAREHREHYAPRCDAGESNIAAPIIMAMNDVSPIEPGMVPTIQSHTELEMLSAGAFPRSSWRSP